MHGSFDGRKVWPTRVDGRTMAGSGTVSTEAEKRLRGLNDEIAVQTRVVAELERDSRPIAGAKTVLRNLEQQRQALQRLIPP